MSKLTRQRLSDLLFWLLAGLSAALLASMVLVIGGIVPIDSAADAPDAQAEAIETPAATEPTDSSVTVPPTEPAGTQATTSPTTAPGVELTLVIMTAARGDSWFSARVGSEDGRVLDERVLTQGESVRLRGRRIWLTVGAAGNVDVTVDGKPRELSPGTVSVVLTAARAAAANS